MIRVSEEGNPDSEIMVSYSQLGTWDRCRFSWYLSYVEEWTSKQKKIALDRGNTIHDLLRFHYQEKPTDDEFMDYVRTLSENVPDYDQLAILNHCVKLIDCYRNDFAAFEDRNWTVVDVEKQFIVQLTSPLGRKFDLLCYVDLIIEINGKIWLVEHKSGQKFWNPIETMMDSQTPTYAAILRELGLDVFGIMFNMLKTYEYKTWPQPVDKLFKRELTYRTQVELDHMVIELGKQVDDLLNNRNNIRRSLKRECNLCQFQEPCLMDMKGMPINEIMPANFRKKENKHGINEAGVSREETDSEPGFVL